MPVAHVRMRGLRELPLERLLFVVVLGCSVLLLSVVMIRSEEAAGVTKAAPRTLFRDGFIVAQSHDVRRTESNGTAVLVVATGDDKGERKAVVEEKKSGTQVHVEQQGEHTMTKIKTEDGDEITIKRAANSKKITTISAHEDGKITIENRNEGDTEPPATSKPNAVNSLRAVERGPITKEEDGVSETKDGEEGSTRRVGYEKIAPGKEKPLVVLRDTEMLTADEASLPRRIEADAADADADKKKKVTVVEVGRSLTKVSVQDAKAQENEEVEKEQTLTRRR